MTLAQKKDCECKMPERHREFQHQLQETPSLDNSEAQENQQSKEVGAEKARGADSLL